MAELKPCPFCGGEADHEQTMDESLWSHETVPYRRVRCRQCDIGTDYVCEGYEPTEVEQWNRRATVGQRDTARGVPEGFTVKRSKSGREILVQEEELGGIWTRAVGYDGMAERLLHRLAELWLAAAPTPPDGDAERDRRDAERLRYVLSHGVPMRSQDGYHYPRGAQHRTAEAAIDSAMAASKGEKA